jgi:membrane-associated protease RseP (regulator of RpoE activity)
VYIIVVVHELGHYLTLRVYGIRPLTVRIGTGTGVYLFEFQDTIFIFCPNYSGSAVFYEREEFKSLGWWKQLCVFGSGVGANAVFAIGVMLLWWQYSLTVTNINSFVIAIGGLYVGWHTMVVSGKIIYLCLLPRSHIAEHRTDGMMIREILRRQFATKSPAP